MSHLKVLIAPDKFKGSLSAMEVCQAIAEGLQQGGSSMDIQMHPMADGGDGSLEVIAQHLQLEKQSLETTDPLGRPISAYYYKAEKVAFIELALASGLVLLKENERNPLDTSTYGTGKMIADALAKGCQEIFLFLGGSATHDGGMGIAQALGVHFYDKHQNELNPCGKNLAKVTRIQIASAFDLEKIKFTLLCDVKHTLYGPNGAAAVFAPQKGADEQSVQILDEGLKHFSQQLYDHTGIAVAELPGSGAAGGIAAAMLAIFKAQLKSGMESLADITQLEAQIKQADIVISGEGKLDHQSLQGKLIDGLAALCQKQDKPLFLFVGKNDLSETEQHQLGIAKTFSVMDQADDLPDAMQNASRHLKQLAFSLAQSGLLK